VKVPKVQGPRPKEPPIGGPPANPPNVSEVVDEGRHETEQDPSQAAQKRRPNRSACRAHGAASDGVPSSTHGSIRPKSPRSATAGIPLQVEHAEPEPAKRAKIEKTNCRRPKAARTPCRDVQGNGVANEVIDAPVQHRRGPQTQYSPLLMATIPLAPHRDDRRTLSKAPAPPRTRKRPPARG